MNILVFLKCMFELNQKENNIVITLLVVNNVKITRRILNIYNNRSCHLRNRTQGKVKTLYLSLYSEFCYISYVHYIIGYMLKIILYGYYVKRVKGLPYNMS